MTTDDDIEREILAKGLTAPRVTQASIEAKITSEHYFSAEEGVMGSDEGRGPATWPQSLGLLTFCVLVLKNGFTVTGQSAVASPENFDAEVGRKVARANAVKQVWALEGYLLRERIREEELAEYGPLDEHIAEVCHEANRSYCRALGDDSQPAWKDAPDWQKASAITGVRFIRMNPQATAEDSHRSWLAVKLADGWKYGPEKDPEAKTHPCCVPYAELPPEQRAKDHIFSGIVRAMA
jgi:hypothetical protein